MIYKLLSKLTDKGILCSESPNTAGSPMIAKIFLSTSVKSSWLPGPPPVPKASRLRLATRVLLLCLRSAQYYENKKNMMQQRG